MGTTFEPTYDDHVMELVYKQVPNWSQIQLYSEFEIEKFEALIQKHFSFDYETGKKDMYTAKKDGKLICFYKNITKFASNIVVYYNVSNKLSTDPNFDDEDEAEIDYDQIKVYENLCTDVVIYYNEDTKDMVDQILIEMNDIVHVSDDKKVFFTIGVDSYGFKLMEQEINFTETDISFHYGKDFLPVHEEILNNLTTKFHGLFLFHGDPGTGKCVVGDTFVTLRNKTTGEIQEVSIIDFYNSLPEPE